MTAISSTELREILVEELRKDLTGYHSVDELLSDRPTVQYLTGILYPAGDRISEEEDEELGVGGDDEDSSEGSTGPSLSQSMNPASIGLSFAVAPEHPNLEVSVGYGLYSGVQEQNPQGRPVQRWQRRQVNEIVPIPIVVGQTTATLPGGGRLEWIIRDVGEAFSVTVFLVNRNPTSNTGATDDASCLFQPKLVIYGSQGSHPFIHRIPPGTTPLDGDLESYQLLYKDSFEFAVGHGCAVNWGGIQNERAEFVFTEIIPLFQLPATTPNEMPGLEMQRLADAVNPADVVTALQPLLAEYERWIGRKSREILALPLRLQDTARIHLERCTEALERMRNGLNLIQSDRQIFEAFRFANRAMLLQRSYSAWAQDYRKNGRRNTATPTLTGSWRPFQIAYVLLNLPGIAQPGHRDRRLVDLLWFPTGGGKTEAYLGLTAFTIGLRRLRGVIDGMRGDGGVTVIMRYTLRLLTTQQFQRAAALICACEHLRRQSSQLWGEEPIQIGLWVGSGATPNSIQDASEALDNLRNGREVKEGNPVQLPFCPWCGESLDARHYHIDTSRDRMVVLCPRRECTFYGTPRQPDRGIPALLIDEDIYRQCPTLLIATADKFARLPWKPQTMALFGKVSRRCEVHGYFTHTDNHPGSHRAGRGLPAITVQPCQHFLPPELIIQDELHLISGPLGTVSGLYETAIDELCTRRLGGGVVIPPKVIASTATIRRADDQVRALFARDVRLFPPSGLSAGDSFFAEAQPYETQPGRYYVGVYAPGRSVKTALVRVYAVLLQVANELLAAHGSDVADPYTTLVGYFNSLRELGGALRLVEDDIVQRIEFLANQRRQQRRTLSTENCELTSRISSTKIPEILKLLEQPVGTHGAIDVLLATNMISVGVDVPRLGLMVVNGQPKASAEYIQATSRVGRKREAPGLVVTVYNWSRPRDISHYEHFRPYHEAIYRHVEATSVTPFAPRSRDRALHAVMIALSRLLQENWTANDAASRFDSQHRTWNAIRQILRERALAVEPTLQVEVEDQIMLLQDWWRTMITRHGIQLHYGAQTSRWRPTATYPVLMHPAEEQGSGGSKPTLNSLREVEGQSQLFIKLT